MKKKIFSLLTLLCMVTALLPTNMATVLAYTGTKYGDYLYYQASNGEITITDCDELATKVEIPSEIDGKKVTGIGHGAFYECSYLTSAIIPETVTNIGDSAFSGCTNLESITLPSKLPTLGSFAFRNCNKCKSFENITIPDTVTKIEDGTFYGCRCIKDVKIGNSVKEIGFFAFEGCSNIASVTIPHSLEEINFSAFAECSKLKNVYYNGTETEWSNITIDNTTEESNKYLTTATRTYFAYINISDKDGNKVIDTMQNMGEYIDTSSITVPNGYKLVLYKDKEMTEEYSLDTPISENLTLYVDIIELNKLKIAGAESADIGQKGITESVTFATDKTAKDFVATIKYSDKLNLSTITEKDFSITENLSETKNGYTYLYLTCTYKNDGNMPINTTLNPFDLVFDVSESATANEKLTIEFVSDDNDETYLALGSTGYDFDSLGKAGIKVNPISVKSITINGADEIDKTTQYTAVIFPENATNKDIEWSVDNSGIATISADGILTPVKAGTVKITATAKDGSGISSEKSVNVKVYAQITSLSANVGVWNKSFTPTEREYIIYVPKSTSIIKIKPTHNSNGELKGTTTLTNGRNNNFSLTDTETVLTLTYSEPDYTDSEYKIKIVKFEGTKTTVSEDGKTFTVKPINIANGNTVILALYNGNTFVGMEAPQEYNGEEKLTFETNKSYTNAKIMVWDSLEGMQPQCEAETVNTKID